MEMHERIKELRKKHLKLSQEAFGELLGVSRSVIKNIELNLLARPEQKLSLVRLMCKEFGVNEEWILNGTGPMFVQPDSFSLDQFAKEHGMTEQDLRIFKLYFSLDPKVRHDAIAYFMNGLAEEPTSIKELQEEGPQTADEMEKRFKAFDAKSNIV